MNVHDRAASPTRPSAWRSLDRYLMTHSPDLWLMKIHWVVVAAALAFVTLATGAMFVPLSPLDQPDLSWWYDVSMVAAVGVALGWGALYLLRASPSHAILQWSAPKLFLGHLVCLGMIVLPARVVPEVLFWRFDRISSAALEQDVREHLEACACIGTAPPRATEEGRDEASRYADIACHDVRFSPERRDEGRCDDAGERALAVRRILAVHERHGLSTAPADQSRVIAFAEERPKDSPSATAERPAPIPELQRLWDAWCYLSSEGSGICQPRAVFGAQLSRRENVESATIEQPRGRLARSLFLALVACYLATLLTAVRLGAGKALVKVALLLVAVDLVADGSWFSAGLVRSSFAAGPVVGAVVTICGGAVVLVGVGRILARRGATIRRELDVLAAAGCVTAPLVPVLLMMQPNRAYRASAVDILRRLGSWELRQSQAWSEQHLGGVPAHLAVAAGAVLCTALASWVLMEAWRQGRITPGRE